MHLTLVRMLLLTVPIFIIMMKLVKVTLMMSDGIFMIVLIINIFIRNDDDLVSYVLLAFFMPASPFMKCSERDPPSLMHFAIIFGWAQLTPLSNCVPCKRNAYLEDSNVPIDF